MAVGDANVFPGLLSPALTQLYFRSHLLLFSHASAVVRGKNTKGSSPEVGINSQVQGHESDTLTTQPPKWAKRYEIFLICH